MTVNNAIKAGEVLARAPLSAVRAQAMRQAELSARRYYAQKLRSNSVLRAKHRARLKKQRSGESLSAKRDIVFVFALILAIFKDMLDLVLIGSLPLIGTVITFCISFVIIALLMMHAAGAKHQRVRKMIHRGGFVTIASMIEGIAFGLNFLPIETIVVAMTYLLVLKDRRKQRSHMVRSLAHT